MVNLLNSKRAVMDLTLKLVLGLFAFGIIILFAYIFLSNFISRITATSLSSAQMVQTGNDFLGTILLFDKLVVFIMVAGIIGVGYLGFRTIKPRVFFIFTIFGAVFMGLVSYIFNYTFAQYATNAAITVAAAFFPLTIIVCTNLHWVSLAGIVIGSLTMYAKKDEISEFRR